MLVLVKLIGSYSYSYCSSYSSYSYINCYSNSYIILVAMDLVLLIVIVAIYTS